MERQVASIRALLSEAFARGQEYWTDQVRNLNQELGLEGKPERLKLPLPGCPPPWFNGDVEALEPGAWVLVLSLNPHIGAEEESYAWSEPPYRFSKYWDTCRLHTLRHWYPRFFRPLTTLAAAALGEAVPSRENEAAFASRRVVFTELVPYASASLNLDTSDWQTLTSDPACQLAVDIRGQLLQMRPAFVLVNGKGVIYRLGAEEESRLRWTPVEPYPSDSHPQKLLQHREGHLQGPSGERMPIVGFPFLRIRTTHNSSIEIGQLANAIAAMRSQG